MFSKKREYGSESVHALKVAFQPIPEEWVNGYAKGYSVGWEHCEKLTLPKDGQCTQCGSNDNDWSYLTKCEKCGNEYLTLPKEEDTFVYHYWDNGKDLETLKDRVDDLEGENHFLKQEIKQLKQQTNPLQEILNRNVIKRLGELEEWQKIHANTVTSSKNTKQKPKK